MSTTLLCRAILTGVMSLSASVYNFATRFVSFSAPVDEIITKTVRSHRANSDKIVDLPGVSFDLNFEQFSGYLDVSSSRHVFYWYIESQSDPTNDPVVLWTNGGPGCSGLLGMGVEQGPYFISKEGKLNENPFSWNKYANMLYIEQPAGVGFSFFDNDADAVTGDAQAAADNYVLIEQFLKRFPKRRSNDFFIASESYGGHYIPQLALEILKRNTDGAINFKGFLVGNPYVDPLSNLVTQVEAYYSHGLLAKPLFDQWKAKCTNTRSFNSKECDKLMQSLFQEFGDGINPYALDYPVCKEDGADPYSLKPSNSRLFSEQRSLKEIELDPIPGARMHADSGVTATSSQVQALLNQTGQRESENDATFVRTSYEPCSMVYLQNYLDQPEVRQALHVRSSQTDPWHVCGGVDYSDEDVLVPTMALYQELVDQGKSGTHDLRMLVYSGDDDSICSTAGTQWWIWDLADVDSMWKAWSAQDQTSGFATSFDLGRKSNATLSFVTVHGAGHEVPSYRPLEALELFRRFVKGEW